MLRSDSDSQSLNSDQGDVRVGTELSEYWVLKRTVSVAVVEVDARRELEDGEGRLLSEVDFDVADRRQNLVSVVVGVVLGVLARLQAHVEARHDRQQVPLELQQSVALARAQRAETHHRVLHLPAELVELGVDETVILEYLR